VNDYRERLISARYKLGLSERKMAEALLTPVSTYKNWESGSRRCPGIAVVASEGMLRTALPRGAKRRLVSDLRRLGMDTHEISAQLGINPKAIHAHDHRLRSGVVSDRYDPDRRRKIAELADGTRTATEIAKILDISISAVAWNLRSMIAEGDTEVRLRKSRMVHGPRVVDRIDRYKKIRDWREAGETLKEIGEKLGLTKERIRQILMRPLIP
jgi:hypothetical protein